jgi:hypothetical protein
VDNDPDQQSVAGANKRFQPGGQWTNGDRRPWLTLPSGEKLLVTHATAISIGQSTPVPKILAPVFDPQPGCGSAAGCNDGARGRFDEQLHLRPNNSLSRHLYYPISL